MTVRIQIFEIAILCTSALLILIVFASSEISKSLISDTDDFKCDGDFTPGLQNPLSPKPVTFSDQRDYDVVVIGAGVSGLEAANELKMEGKNVVILEGRDRIGGRIYTEIHNGVSYDIGGSWIHGLEGLTTDTKKVTNPIYRITQENGIALIQTYNKTVEDATDTSSYGSEGYERFFDSSGHKIDIDSQRQYYMIDKQDDIKDKWIEMRESKTSDIDPKRLDKVLREYESKNKNFIDSDIYWHLAEWRFEQEAIGDINQLSSEHLKLEQYFYNDPTEGIFPEGYTQIANCLAGELRILHANVTEIDYTHEPVTVTTANNEKFTAKRVISTIPLGVLQKNDALFKPKLFENSHKKDALKNLGMGTMDKVYLIFDVAFWDSEEHMPGKFNAYIHRVAKAGDEEDKPWKFFLNLHTYTGKPVLIAFHTGSTAIKLENKTDEELAVEAKQVLEKMFPTSKSQILEPKVVRTKWAKDPLSFGSYSFLAVTGTADDFDKLREPIDNKLFFAGEATERCSFGTVHGAYTSGYRAAQEILALDGNIDAPSEQIAHGIEEWDIVGSNPTIDEIPERCGGNLPD